MGKKLTYIILIVLSAAFLVSGYLIYSHFKKPTLPPREAIPASAVIFAEFNGIRNSWQELKNGNEMHESFLAIPEYKEFWKEISSFDSLGSQYEAVTGILETNQQFISLHLDTANRASLLFISGIPKSMRDKAIPGLILSMMPPGHTLLKETFQGADLWMLDTEKPWYFAIYKKVFAGSTNPDLVRSAIDKMQQPASIYPEEFLKVQQTAGKKVDANLYIRQSDFHRFFRFLTGPGYVYDLEHLASWTELDLNIKSDEILLNGYTSVNDTFAGQMLRLFENQTPQTINITRILPYHTNFLFSYGFSDFKTYHNLYTEFLKRRNRYEEYSGRLRRLNQVSSRDMIRYFFPWTGREVALVITQSGAANPALNKYTVIHAADPEKAAEQLGIVADPNFLVNYKDYLIRKIHAPGLMEILFGNLFTGMDQYYFSNIEDYYVFSGSQEAMENFINSFLSGKTLKSNINFKRFTDNISDRSNLFFYLNTRNGTEITRKYLNEEIRGFLTENTSIIRNFEGMAMQLSSMNRMFYTNLYIKYNPSYIQEDYALWKVSLDDEISGQPYFVRDHRTNTLKIVLFDKSYQMYLIDHNGKIIWKRMIGEPVLSDVHLVDYYRNGKVQYLFNTENSIYLVDLLGRDVEEYPVRLPGKASNGIAVFDYDGDRNYRMLVAMEDNRVYNFDKKGLPVTGWKKPLSKNTVVDPVEYIRAFNKDYIIITDQEGNVRICDRKGNDRINLRADFTNARHSAFYENKTNSAKGVMITTDSEGMLTYLKPDGSIARTGFGEFSPDHYFLYEDFDRNGHKDFIFLDKNKLMVYDRFKNPIMSYEFKNEIGSSPVVIPLSGEEIIIGIVSDETRKIYLFDKDGNLLSTPDMIGNTQILVGSLLNDGQLNIIAGSGRTLFNYYFQ